MLKEVKQMILRPRLKPAVFWDGEKEVEFNEVKLISIVANPQGQGFFIIEKI